jgi:hypothetical protein
VKNQQFVRIVVWVLVAALVLGVAASLTALFL